MTKEQIKGYEKQSKPCKHCGHRARLEQTIFGGWFIRCGNYLCDVFPITEGTFKTPEEAIEYWNNDLPMESGRDEDICEKCRYDCLNGRYVPSGNPCECCSNGGMFEPKEKESEVIE